MVRSGLRVGRLFGIQLFIDWSWLFIFLLLTWNLYAVFSHWHPQWEPLLRLSVAVVAAVMFFGSVLLHELAHSLVAKAHGIPVRSITLFLFGGVSSFEREPPSPRVEFVSAIVGPLTSLILGGVFLLLGSLSVAPLLEVAATPAEALRALGPIPTLLLWLGPINVLVGLFNLIPAFPLDGGRVLRALLWATVHNLRKATRWAAGVGQAIAWLFIVTGLAMAFGLRVPFFGTGVISGLWLAFIGWFLNTAAVQSYRQVVIQDLLHGVPVGRLMRTRLVTVPGDLSVSRLVNEWIMGSDERAFPVMDHDVFVGLVCLDDIRKVPSTAWEHTTVAQIMTPLERLVTVAPHDDAAEALEQLSRRDVAQLPVMDNGRLVGMLRLKDITRWLELQHDQELGWEPASHPT